MKELKLRKLKFTRYNETFIPLLEGMKGHGVEYENETADAGYERKENYTYFETRKKNCYIKPQNNEWNKTKKSKGNMALRMYWILYFKYVCRDM